jgi:hypothetical protein
MTFPLAARAAMVDLIDSMLLCLRRKGISPKDFLDFLLLLLESIKRSARSTLGPFLQVGFLSGSLLEVTVCFIMAVDESVLFAMVSAPITILALLGFLGAALLLRGIALALLILLQDATSLHCFSSFENSLLLEGFLKPLLVNSFLSIFYLKMIEIIEESLITYHVVVFILLINLILH